MNTYDGVEALDSFPSHKDLIAYRAEKLEASRDQAKFLAQFDVSRVHEVGCGNGRIAFALAEAGMGAYHGIDIAASRVEFGQHWARDEGMNGLEFATADAFHHRFEPQQASLSICLTGAFGYFDCLKPGGATRVLESMIAGTRPGGTIVIEAYTLPDKVRLCKDLGGALRTWQELPAADPWRFYLSHYTWDEGQGIMHHEKTFIGRDGVIDEGRRESLRIRDAAEMATYLEEMGLQDVRIHDGWSGDRAGPNSPIVVAVATRPDFSSV